MRKRRAKVVHRRRDSKYGKGETKQKTGDHSKRRAPLNTIKKKKGESEKAIRYVTSTRRDMTDRGKQGKQGSRTT